jgi:hypothetical protein
MIDEASLLRTPSTPIQSCGIVGIIWNGIWSLSTAEHRWHKKGEALTFVGASSDAKEVFLLYE